MPMKKIGLPPLTNVLQCYSVLTMEARALKEWRRKHRLTQKQLAQALGVTTMAVAYWEQGRRGIPALLPLALEALENQLQKGGRQ